MMYFVFWICGCLLWCIGWVEVGGLRFVCVI